MPLFIQLKYTDIKFCPCSDCKKKFLKLKDIFRRSSPATYTCPKIWLVYYAPPPIHPINTARLLPQGLQGRFLWRLEYHNPFTVGPPGCPSADDDPALHAKLTRTHNESVENSACWIEEEYWREKGRTKRRLGMDALTTHDSKACVRAGGWRD